MDSLSEDLEKMDGDPQMTMLTRDHIFREDRGVGDEVEDLQQSLREAVHDEAVQPKMQCLMMDPSFSMVAVQGEDSGIEWETTPSRCTTPWEASRSTTPWEASRSTTPWTSDALEFGTPVPTRPSTPGSGPAGRIIFVMDDEMLLKRKKSKGSSRRSRAEKPKPPPLEVLDGVSGRPELVEVSVPNVKVEGGGGAAGDEAARPAEDKEQRLFRWVSEGSEILNIVVPQKLVSVDEEESGVMVDNLSYLEESLVVKLTEDISDDVLEASDEAAVSTQAPAPSHGLNLMDPPGAPVARPLAERARREDYFEKFTRIDAQAPGSPAVVRETRDEGQAEEDGEVQDGAEPEQPKGKSTPVAVPVYKQTFEALGAEEIDCQLLDEVFYGGMEDNLLEISRDRVDEPPMSPRSPLKKSGSSLFGSQENILTPIFLPEGPAKIIDQILLEEPKAMAFLYTDLYEEAVGSRERDEDAQSMTSEKSFHSRHSDREARGYLEKYMLIDETPMEAVEAEPVEEEDLEEGGIRILSRDSYSDFLPSHEEDGDEGAAGEEITDFFRSSANSSPSLEPFPPVQEEEDDAQANKKGKKKKSVAKAAVPRTPVQPGKTAEEESVPEIVAPLGVSGRPASASSGGDSKKAHRKDVQPQPLPPSKKTSEERPKPVAPPRRKSALGLVSLTPVDGEEECGVKEQREEEKETASPAETADEGEGDDKETGEGSSAVALTEDVPELTLKTGGKPGGDTSLLGTVDGELTSALSQLANLGDRPGKGGGGRKALFSITQLTKASETDVVPGGGDTETVDGALAEGNDIEPLNEAEIDLAETAVETEEGGDRGGDSAPPTSVTEAAKESGRCIIL